jgi:O-antigen/teichoic acid export membrane protein
MSKVFRDAFWQIWGRIVWAFAGFLVIKILTFYLWPLRYGDYSTILKYFALWSALSEFWVYVIAINKLWKIKEKKQQEKIYHKFLWVRFFLVMLVYSIALLVAFFIPSYNLNPFISHW